MSIVPGVIACGSRNEISQPCDLYWDDVVLAMHMDGIDGSTTFTDEKGHSATRFGNAVISTTQSKFGGASAYFDGSGDYLTFPYSTDFNAGDSDFTISGWFRLTSLPGANRYIFSTVNTSGTFASMFHIGVTEAGLLTAQCTNSGWATTVALYGPAALNTDTWYYFMFLRSGSTYSLYQDGVLCGTSTPAGITLQNNGLTIGALFAGSDTFPGYIDDLLLTINTARTDFSVPSQSFSETDVCYTPIPDVPAFVITEKEVVTEEPPEFIPDPPAPALTGAGGRMLTILGDYAYCVNKNVQDEVIMFNKTTLEVIERGGHGYFGSTYGINDLCTNGTNKIYATFNQGIMVFQPTGSELNKVLSKEYSETLNECLQLKYASGSLWLRRPTCIERLDPDTLEIEETFANDGLVVDEYTKIDTDGTHLYVNKWLITSSDPYLKKINGATNVIYQYTNWDEAGVLHVVSNDFAYFQTSKIDLTTGVSSAHSLLLTYSKDTNNAFVSKFNNIFTHYLAGDKGKGVIKIIDSTDDTVVSTITNFQELAFGSGYGTYWSQFYKISTGMGLLSEDKLIISNGDIYGNHSSGYSVYELQ